MSNALKTRFGDRKHFHGKLATYPNTGLPERIGDAAKREFVASVRLKLRHLNDEISRVRAHRRSSGDPKHDDTLRTLEAERQTILDDLAKQGIDPNDKLLAAVHAVEPRPANDVESPHHLDAINTGDE